MAGRLAVLRDRHLRRRRELRRLAQGRPGGPPRLRARRRHRGRPRTAGQPARRRVPQRAVQPARRDHLDHPRPERDAADQRPRASAAGRAVLRRHGGARQPADNGAGRRHRADFLPLRQGVHALPALAAGDLAARHAAVARGPGQGRAGHSGDTGGTPGLLRPGELLQALVLTGDARMSSNVGIVIVGAGFGGIGMAIALKKAGFGDFVILEKDHDLGGTWRDNTYPGCACDVPAPLYSYSYDLNPAWTRIFAPQQEIWDYLRMCSGKDGVDAHIRYGRAVEGMDWDDDARRW